MNVTELLDVDTTAADTLLQHAHSADGVEAFGEAFVRGLDDDSFGHRHFAIIENDRYLGLAAVAPDAVEMVVDPEFRKQGVGAKLLAHIDAEVGERLPIWAHGDVAGASRLAELTQGRPRAVADVHFGLSVGEGGGGRR